MRIRTVKPEFWRNKKLASLGREIHGFAARLLNAADDEGYFESYPETIAGDVLPFDSDGQKFVKRALPELERIGFIELFENDVARIVKFKEHQRINRPSPSRLGPRKGQRLGNKGFSEYSVSPHASLSEPSPTEVEQGAGSREQGREQGSDVGALAHAWNEITTPPQPRVLSPDDLGVARSKAAAAALKRRSLDDWRAVFKRLNETPLCRGAMAGGWIADFDWAIRPEGAKPEPATKLLEGSFDRISTPAIKPRDPPNRVYAEGKVTI